MTIDKRLQQLLSSDRYPPAIARRASERDLVVQVQTVSNSPVVTALLETVDAILLVLNEHRQIVAFNDRVARVNGQVDAIGLLPGDALCCVNARSSGGCGTTAACSHCGALSAVQRCQAERVAAEAECLVRSVSSAGASFEFNVRAAPVVIDETPFTVMSLRDISGEKRRHALEQIFLHDVMNTVAGLRGWTLRLRRAAPGDPAGLRAAERIDVLSRQIEREIQDHRALILAESGALAPDMAVTPADELLGRLEAVFSFETLGEGRRLEIDAARGIAVHTDASLLLRILVNMVRNALEAVPEGSTVRVWCERIPRQAPDAAAPDVQRDPVQFSVWNDGVIPPAVQARIFQRSFSTKAARGRGLGTYSMKLLGERILGGEVAFSSSVGSGTVFTVTLPAPPAPASKANRANGS